MYTIKKIRWNKYRSYLYWDVGLSLVFYHFVACFSPSISSHWLTQFSSQPLIPIGHEKTPPKKDDPLLLFAIRMNHLNPWHWLYLYSTKSNSNCSLAHALNCTQELLDEWTSAKRLSDKIICKGCFVGKGTIIKINHDNDNWKDEVNVGLEFNRHPFVLVIVYKMLKISLPTQKKIRQAMMVPMVSPKNNSNTITNNNNNNNNNSNSNNNNNNIIINK